MTRIENKPGLQMLTTTPLTGRVTKQDYIDTAKELGVTIVNEPIKPGDLYLAGRNTGIKFLTCKSVNPQDWIVPTTADYSFDTWECVKVIET